MSERLGGGGGAFFLLAAFSVCDRYPLRHSLPAVLERNACWAVNHGPV